LSRRCPCSTAVAATRASELIGLESAARALVTSSIAIQGLAGQHVKLVT
jgi:hypothetical protein